MKIAVTPGDQFVWFFLRIRLIIHGLAVEAIILNSDVKDAQVVNQTRVWRLLPMPGTASRLVYMISDFHRRPGALEHLGLGRRLWNRRCLMSIATLALLVRGPDPAANHLQGHAV